MQRAVRFPLASGATEGHYQPMFGVAAMSDEQIAAEVQAGDADSFGILMERYEAKLLRYGRKFLPRQEDIEDIVQDVFVSAFKNIRSYDSTRPLSPWLFRIAHNAFVNGLRRQSRNPLTMLDFDTFVSHYVDEGAPVDLAHEQKEMRGLIERGLEALSPKSREILVLFYLEEFSYQEIADILQVPIGTVGVRLKRAREALKGAYEKMNIQYGE